ncbi:MAG TPA: enoyl-CoA hydratase-related protein [Actinomycetota bacterium]|nr:enoyl-CoA hydratase-related protein [Actinomycetota bacterium]
MSLVTSERKDRIATITLNRPESLNAISGDMADELTEAFEDVAHDRESWVVILRGAGEKTFCVGADLKERAGFSLEDFHTNRKRVKGMFAALRAIPQPTIASIFGATLGGGFELALSCDLIVAAHSATVGLPEVRVGLLPAGGGTQLLTRKLGTARAKDFIFRARMVDAEHAHELGLIAAVCERAELDAQTLALAEEIARSSSPVAVRAAKRAIDGALGVPIDEGIEIEHDAWAEVIASEDRAEGIAAFNSKREPNWRNR